MPKSVSARSVAPAFCEGIQYYGDSWPEAGKYAAPVIAASEKSIRKANDPGAVYQPLLAAHALRYLTLQVTGAKASDGPFLPDCGSEDPRSGSAPSAQPLPGDTSDRKVQERRLF